MERKKRQEARRHKVLPDVKLCAFVFCSQLESLISNLVSAKSFCFREYNLLILEIR